MKISFCGFAARQYVHFTPAHSHAMACSAFVVGVTAAREAGLFRGLEADDSATDGTTDTEFGGVWPGCALTVVCLARLHQHSDSVYSNRRSDSKELWIQNRTWVGGCRCCQVAEWLAVPVRPSPSAGRIVSVELQLGARAEGDGTNWSLRVYDAVDEPSALSEKKGQRVELKLVVRSFQQTSLSQSLDF